MDTQAIGGWNGPGPYLIENNYLEGAGENVMLEMKNARRVLVEGNVLERCWTNGQAGLAVVLTPRNQGGTAPWSGISDITLRYNIIRHAGGASRSTATTTTTRANKDATSV